RYPLTRSGSSFAPVKEIDFAAGAPTDPYGFKPTDLVVDRAGGLFIADWADGQRPRRGRGRVYHVRYVGTKEDKRDREKERRGDREKKGEAPGLAEMLRKLDSESYYERFAAQEAIEAKGKEGVAAVVDALKNKRLQVRGRLHAVWILAKVEGPGAIEKLFALAETDADPRVQAQAVRALADLTDQVLVKHRLEAGAGDGKIAARVAALVDGKDPRVVLEAIITLGRLRWADTPAWLHRHLKRPDPFLAHAAQQAFRRVDNWQGVLKLLDEPGTAPIR